MANAPIANVAGLPAPKTVVAELRVHARPEAAGSRPGRAPAYRIIRTNQVDPYDAPVPTSAIAAIGAPAAPPSDSFARNRPQGGQARHRRGKPDEFADLKKFFDDLPSDADMTEARSADHHRTRIPTGCRRKSATCGCRPSSMPRAAKMTTISI